MQDVLRYEGRRVVVTGAASGMGAATACLLADLGATVVGADVAPITAPVAKALTIDLRDRHSIEVAANAIDGPIDAVFNCAGLPGAPFSDLSVMLVNFLGPRYLVERLVPKMPPGSAVSVVASVAALGWQQHVPAFGPLLATEGFDEGRDWCLAHPDLIATGYGPSKKAMTAWTAWRAFTLISDGIRLNCLNPGPTDTPMMATFEDQAGGASVVDLFTQPIARRSTPEEQAWALVMLNSPRLSYVNGHPLFADGGFSAAVQVGRIDPASLFSPAGR